jgi:hypothetical protein
MWTPSEPSGLAFEHDARSLAGVTVWNLVTDHGRLDIWFQPSATTGYADLARDAVHLTILRVEVDVASLADVIRSKEAAGREKDRLALPRAAPAEVPLESPQRSLWKRRKHPPGG